VYPRDPITEQLIIGNSTHYFDDTRTPTSVETKDDILARALHIAIDKMYELYGPDDSNWEYGLHHTINIEHLAGIATIEGGGIRGQHTLFPSRGWDMSSGPVWRNVVDLSDFGNSRQVIPGGQSGNPLSPHFDDLFQLWFAFDETSRHYDYIHLYVYTSVQEFITEDSGVIERTIILLPLEVSG
jgi:penicillin amidase